MREPDIGSYLDRDGARHRLIVRASANGRWHVLDVNVTSDTTHTVDTLAGEQDGRPQAEAIARDYLTTIEHSATPAGREPAQAISEQGGRDAHSHRRPRTEPRKQPVRRVALPHPAR
jgi:hypothetical protein